MVRADRIASRFHRHSHWFPTLAASMCYEYIPGNRDVKTKTVFLHKWEKGRLYFSSRGLPLPLLWFRFRFRGPVLQLLRLLPLRLLSYSPAIVSLGVVVGQTEHEVAEWTPLLVKSRTRQGSECANGASTWRKNHGVVFLSHQSTFFPFADLCSALRASL